VRSIKLPSWTERLLGIDARPVPPHVFTVDVGTLVYGRFVRSESGYEVEDFAQIDLPQDLFAEGPLGGPMHDPGLFRPLLEELVKSVDVPLDEASLVLPDAWLRLAFADMEELPSRGARRDELLRWKLKRLVPFRVEDLRLEGVPAITLPEQEAKHRLLIGFAIDVLLRQFEQVFEACGVRIGQILNTSLATVESIRSVVDGAGLGVLALVGSTGYSLTFMQHGEPLLHRFRALDTAMGGEAAAQLVLRDLKLTRSFLEEQLPGLELARILLVSQTGQQRFWLDSLEQGLGQVPVALGREQLPLRGELPEVAPTVLAPMLGAACREVA